MKFIKSIVNFFRLIFTNITDSLKGLASAIVWGSGQLLNKEFGKALFFFSFQFIAVMIELLTGKYFKGGVTHLRDSGFFLRGLWGLTTLGERVTGLEEISVPPFFLEVKGDVSDTLMLEGLISTIVLLLFLIILIWSVKDAFVSSYNYKKTGVRLSSKDYFKKVWRNGFPYIILTPSLILVLLISIMPILFGFIVAFTNYNKQNLPPDSLVQWVGLKNFINIFGFGSGTINFSVAFKKVFTWTIVWTIISSATCFFGGFIQALIINNKRVRFTVFWRTLLIIPWAIPGMVSLLIFKMMFHEYGFMNNFLLESGIIVERLRWLEDIMRPNLARGTVILINIWLGYPYFMALLTGVMTSINKELYEAADIDGANSKQKFFHITFPLVLYMTAPLLIMTVATNFNNFGVIYFLTGGGPGGSPGAAYAGSTDLLITWIYKLTVDPNIRMYNMASVFSIIIFLIIGTVSTWNFTRTKAFKEEDMI
ncbi:sugar ABC transporter permease [Mycoplasmatota bacterium]|nr:sugar ABC transporter permease [Mycoplasmatota bacterium]